MNIFVPNYVDTNDYSEAEAMGELVFVTKGINMNTPEQLHVKFAKYFADAEPEDMLLLSGSNLVCSVAYAEWSRKFPTERKLMTYDRRNGYSVHTLSN